MSKCIVSKQGEGPGPWVRQNFSSSKFCEVSTAPAPWPPPLPRGRGAKYPQKIFNGPLIFHEHSEFNICFVLFFFEKYFASKFFFANIFLKNFSLAKSSCQSFFSRNFRGRVFLVKFFIEKFVSKFFYCKIFLAKFFNTFFCPFFLRKFFIKEKIFRFSHREKVDLIRPSQQTWSWFDQSKAMKLSIKRGVSLLPNYIIAKVAFLEELMAFFKDLMHGYIKIIQITTLIALIFILTSSHLQTSFCRVLVSTLASWAPNATIINPCHYVQLHFDE